MKHNHFKIFLFIVAACFIAGSSIYSQNKPNNVVYQTQDSPAPTWKTSAQDNVQVPAELQSLIEQQKTAKKNGNDVQVKNLQEQIDAFGGSVSVKAGYMDAGTGGLLHGSWHGMPTDNVVETKIFTSPANSYIKAFCTATEQRGANVGRIWSCWAWGSTSFTTPDTLLVFYSDNGGLSWNGNSFWIPGGFSKVNYDQLDMEIMEYTTGNKYVWISGGFTNNGSQQNVACIVIQTPTAGANFFNITWPGGTTNTNVYRPRITSDNSNYNTSSSWLFMVAGRDSLNTAGSTHKIGEKFAKCTNPFTTAPTITYRGACYGFDVNYSGLGSYYLGADHCDIAYFQNGGLDSLIVVESNLPDTTTIYCNKSGESPETNGSVNFANLNSGGAPSVQKQYARVSSNGSNRIMMVYRSNFNNSGDWDIRYSLSTNGGIPAAGWANNYVDGFGSTVTYPYQPDITGLRGTSTFKCSYVYFSSGFDSAMTVSAPNGTTWGTPYRTNQTGLDVSILASSHAGYRYVNNDSCLTLWSEYSGSGGINLWAGTGCSGTIVTEINHNGNEIPKTYSLSQNYPNPFNPSTDIKFSIPKNSLVKLTVFDITGKEIATLVNGELSAGNYKYNFDASNLATGVYFYKVEADGFTDVKKMMLIK